MNWPAAAGFFALCAFTMLNLNFFTRTFLETDQVLSIFYLLACLLVLFALKFPLIQSIGNCGLFFMASIATYLAVSTRMGMGVDSSFFTSLSSDVYRIVTAQLITLAAAAGARHLYLAGKQQMTLRIAFALTLLAGLTIILSKIFPVLAVRYMQGRLGGVFTDANAAGHALCYSAAIGFACLINEKSVLVRGFVFVGLALLIPCLILTNSRSSIIFMALLVGAQFFISPILKQKGTIVAIIVLVVGVPIGIQVAVNKEASRVNAYEAASTEAQQDRLASLLRIMRGDISEEDTGHRFVVGAVGLKYFASSPIVGVGFHKLTRMQEVNLGCHNTFIRVLGEGGIFCGILYMLSFVVIGLAGWKCKAPEVRCLVVGFIVSYFCSAMVAHTQLTSRISNVLLGICLGFLSAVVTIKTAENKRRRTAIHQEQQKLKASRLQTVAPLAR